MEGNYQIASITALILLVPSVGFMLVIERFLKADVLAKVGSESGSWVDRIDLNSQRPVVVIQAERWVEEASDG